MRNLVILLIFVGMMLFGCKQAGDSVDSFVSRPVERIEVVIPVPDTVAVRRFLYYGNETLILAGNGPKHILYSLDIKSNEGRGLVNRGKGPGEALSGWSIFKADDGDLFLHSASDAKLLQMHSTNGGFELVEERNMETMPLRLRRLNGKTLIMPMNLPGIRFQLLDEEGNEVMSVPFPDSYSTDNNAKANNLAFQSLLEVSPDGNVIVTAGLSSPYLDIYSSTLELVTHFHGPFSDDDKFCFSGLSVGPKGVVAGVADDKGNTGMLLQFDLKGKPLKKYELPKPVSAFDVDWGTGRVFGLSIETGEIICYKIEIQ